MSLVEQQQIAPELTILTLNRQEKRNALSIQLMQELQNALQGEQTYLLTGEGKVFSSGLDLHETIGSEEPERLLVELVRTLSQRRVVVLLNGPALAGGAALVTACTFAVGTPESRIGFPATYRGLTAAVAMSFLRRQLPDRIVREMLLTGRPLSAEESLRYGLLDKVVSPSQLLPTAVSLAEGRLSRIA